MINTKICLVLLSFVVFACGDSQRDKLAQKEQELLQKENDLLKKENELLKKAKDETAEAKEEEEKPTPIEVPHSDKANERGEKPSFAEAEEAKKNMVKANLSNYVTHTLKYTPLNWGGLDDVIVGINNTSDYHIDQVLVHVTYITAYETVYKTEVVFVQDIAPHSKKTVFAPNSSRGTKLRAQIARISSMELNIINPR